MNREIVTHTMKYYAADTSLRSLQCETGGYLVKQNKMMNDSNTE